MLHINPNPVVFMGNWLKSPHNTNRWAFSIHYFAMTLFCFKDPNSLKFGQFGAVGGQMRRLGVKNYGSRRGRLGTVYPTG
eukprot:1142845-Pelagomonas_calceolata.AAC.7